MSKEEDANKPSYYIGIDDPDVPIYRIYRNRFFKDELQQKKGGPCSTGIVG